jgi:hypothetical protein
MSTTISSYIEPNGYITIPSMAEMAKHSPEEFNHIIDQIIIAIRNKRIGFPYKYNQQTSSIESLHTMFRNLTLYQPISSTEYSTPPHNLYRIQHKSSILREKMKHKLSQYKHDREYRALVWQEQPTDYDTIDQLTDYFTESQRMSAGRIDKNYKTPLELWAMTTKKDEEMMREILGELLKSKEGLTHRSFRDAFWKTGLEANSFKTTVASSVYWYFDAKRILDISAGWGDRLMAAMAHRAERYVAYDPNINLKPGHDEMKRVFAGDYADRYEVRYTGFETGQLGHETFDLIFTSPPYFNFEQYSKSSIGAVGAVGAVGTGQSMETYPRFNQWFVRFLCMSLSKAWANLDTNGNMVIHITDIGGIKDAEKNMIVEPMILYVLGYCACSGFDGVMGTIGYTGRPRPMWVFHKYGDETIEVAKKARMELAQLYPDIARLV